MSVRKKKEREKTIQKFWRSHPASHDADVISDIVDRGNHIKVTSCTREVAAWWMGTLRAVYPQDRCSGSGERIKMHPEEGVTLQLNKEDGTLRIKGKKHMEWFKGNFENLVAQGSKDLALANEMGRVIDSHLRLSDGYTVQDLLDHLPTTGALKHGPTYIYRLWRGVLDRWIGEGGDVYVVSPLMDSRRLCDVILTVAKHRLVQSRVHMYVMPRCDGELKFPKVFKEAKEMARSVKGPNKKRLLAEERINLAVRRLATRFGRFHCKFVAFCPDGSPGSSDEAEILMTSASFHRFHFEMESGDTVVHFRLPLGALINNYLAPLGLEHQVSTVDTPSLSPASGPTTPDRERLPPGTSPGPLASPPRRLTDILDQPGAGLDDITS